MKKLGLLLVVIFITTATNIKAQGIKFFKGTHAEVLAEAKKQNKKVFIDFYTKWCGPCKKMDKTIFKMPEVGKFYNEKFICYKVDAEEPEGRVLADRYNVRSFPTFIYTDVEGNSLYNKNSSGYRTEKDFIRLASLALGIEEKDWNWYQKEYAKGNRSAEFLEGYFTARFDENKSIETYEELLMLFKAYPDGKVWSEKKRQLARDGASYGNEFYKIIVNNKQKFPFLKDKEQAARWLAGNLRSFDSDESQLEKVYENLKAEFPQYIDVAYEFIKLNQYRLNDQAGKYVEEMLKFRKKHKTMLGADSSVAFSAIKAKDIRSEDMKAILDYYSHELISRPDDFHIISACVYLTHRLGNVAKAKQMVEKYSALTAKYADSKKMKWAYGLMQRVKNGETVLPFTY